MSDLERERREAQRKKKVMSITKSRAQSSVGITKGKPTDTAVYSMLETRE